MAAKLHTIFYAGLPSQIIWKGLERVYAKNVKIVTVSLHGLNAIAGVAVIHWRCKTTKPTPIDHLRQLFVHAGGRYLRAEVNCNYELSQRSQNIKPRLGTTGTTAAAIATSA